MNIGNQILAWVKSHVGIVISVVVLIAAPVAGFIVSAGMNESVREKLEQRRSQAENDLRGASRASYSVPAFDPQEPGFEWSGPPNAAAIEAVAAERQRRVALVEGIVDRATLRSSRGRVPLVDSMFPAPVQRDGEMIEDEDTLSKARVLQFSRRLLGLQRERDAYAELYARLRAGGPADIERIREEVQQVIDSQADRMAATTDTGSLTPEQQEQLDGEARDLTIAGIARHARGISVFAPENIVRDGVQGIRIPSGQSTSDSLETAFGWQIDYWTVEDIVRLVELANTEPGGSIRTVVPASPIKRIESISLGQVQEAAVGDGGFDDMGGGGSPQAGGSAEGEGSYTDRLPPSSEAVYAGRRVELVLLVDSARLTRLLQIIESAGMNTVVDVDIASIDPWEHLGQGYFYGEDHVVRATLALEMLMLNQWLDEYRPGGGDGDDGFGDDGGFTDDPFGGSPPFGGRR